MTSDTIFPILIIGTILSSISFTVYGFPYPMNVSIDLTKEESDSRVTDKESHDFRQNLTSEKDELKIMISLCHDSMTVVLQDDYLIENNTSRLISFADIKGSIKDIPNENIRLFINNPCSKGWMMSSIIKDFTLFENGSIYAPAYDGGSISDSENYCLMLNKDSYKYVAKICRPWIKRGYYEIFCVIISMVIMLVIFITFTIVPEFRKFHGLIFRAYIATYIGIYVFALGVQITAGLRINPFWFSFIEITGRYFSYCSASWLNVMSFNIWRSFRNLRPISANLKEQERNKFICYAIYSWIGPIIIFAIAAALMNYVPYLCDDIVGYNFKKWGSVALIMIALFCNILFYTSTAFHIRRQKIYTEDLAHGVNKHYEMERQWFNLYFKLFTIMGAHLIIWLIWLIWPNDITIAILATFEVIQNILLFIIFVFKDNVKRSFCKIFTCKLNLHRYPKNESIKLDINNF